MIRMSVIYSHQEDGQFDFDYYLTKHMPLVESLYSELGMQSWQVDRGASLSSKPPSNIVACAYLFFDSIDALKLALKSKGGDVMKDVQNFTNIEPNVYFSEVIAS